MVVTVNEECLRGGILIVTHLRAPEQCATWEFACVCAALRAPLQFFKALSPRGLTHTYTPSRMIRSAQKLHQRIPFNCHLSQRRWCEDRVGCISIKPVLEEWLIGSDGSGALPASRGHLSAQNQAFIVGASSFQGLLLIWHPFSSLSHLQEGAHTAKGLCTISALFHPFPLSPPPF